MLGQLSRSSKARIGSERLLQDSVQLSTSGPPGSGERKQRQPGCLHPLAASRARLTRHRQRRAHHTRLGNLGPRRPENRQRLKTKFQLGVSSIVFSVVHPMWQRGREAFSCSATRQRLMYRWGRLSLGRSTKFIGRRPGTHPQDGASWRAITGCQSSRRRSPKKVRRLWQHPATANQLCVWLVATPRAKCSTPRRGSVKRLGPYS